MSLIKIALAFTVGAVMGAGATYMVTKEYFRKIADEEIASVKETYGKHALNVAEMNDRKKEEYVKILKESSYVRKDEMDEDMNAQKIDIPKKKSDTPYIITHEDYEDPNYEAYDKIDLTLYSDGVLADDMDEKLDFASTKEEVGLDWMDYMEDNDSDIVYVRNDSHQADFIISKALETYEETHGEENTDN